MMQLRLVMVTLLVTTVVVCVPFSAAFSIPLALNTYLGVLRRQQSSHHVLFETPGWLDDAMGGGDIGGGNTNSDSAAENDRLDRILPLQAPGLAGFAVDEQLGFCAILAASTTTNTTNDATATEFFDPPIVVSLVDRDRITSAEALTMVQLAGGLDLGTPILPPDLLALLVADELADNDSSDVEEDYETGDETATITAESLRGVVSLTRIDVLPPSDSGAAASTTTTSRDELSSPPKPVVASSPERDAAIAESLPRVWTAVKGLPGLGLAKESLVERALQQHADENGSLDREGFSNLLDTLRSELFIPSARAQEVLQQPSNVVFQLTATVITGDAIRTVTMETTNAVHALGLGFRYKIPLNVDQLTDACNHDAGLASSLTSSSSSSLESGGSDPEQNHDHDQSQRQLRLIPAELILERFPVFRPLSELLEDAQIMDGFIPSMVQKSKKMNNDMKE
jgi:hypothetical protein